MGNCISENTGPEDSGLSKKTEQMTAVGANIDEVRTEDIQALINQNQIALKQRLILNFQAEGLPNLDKDSTSDTFVVLYFLKGGKMKQKLGSTEIIQDSLNPQWVNAIETEFFFEESHQFVLELYDCDDGDQPANLSK